MKAHIDDLARSGMRLLADSVRLLTPEGVDAAVEFATGDAAHPGRSNYQTRNSQDPPNGRIDRRRQFWNGRFLHGSVGQRTRSNGDESDFQHLRSLLMRIGAQVAMLAFCVLAGCHDTKPQTPITREVLVGDYFYHSEDDRPLARASDHEWDRLELTRDSRYHLTQGGPTKPRTDEAGTWVAYYSGAGISDVAFHGRIYPIQVKRGEIRLMIDDDLGIWYAKIR
jgi:hypothetical protein